jgi:hypothetical protein
MSRRFIYVYEDPEYVDEAETEEELAELNEMDQFHQYLEEQHESS